MRKVYVGIDVGSKRCAASAIDARGGILDSSVFKTSGSNLVEFVQRQKGEVRVLMEEGELAGWVYRTLLPHAKSVEASDPRRNAWIAKASRKDDRTDALKLAELLRLGSYSPVYHPEDDYMAAFKSAVKHYERIAREVSRMMVRIKARLRSQGVITSGMKVYGARGRLHAIRTVDNQAVREILEQEYRILDNLTREKSKARSLVIRLSRGFPVIERLKKIPGVGPVLSARFVAYVQDPHRFNKRSLARFSQLGIVKRSSDGVSLGREHLEKSGNGALKDLSRKAFQGALKTKKPNGIKTFYARSLSRTKNADHARLNTQRKVLGTMNAMWRDGTEYSDEVFLRKGA